MTSRVTASADHEPSARLPDNPRDRHRSESGSIYWSRGIKNRRLRSFELANGVVIARDAKRRPLASLVREVVRPSFQLAYAMDNGVPYPIAPFAGLLIATAAFNRYPDPVKPLRSAALAGWSFSALEIHPVDLDYLEGVASTAMNF